MSVQAKRPKKDLNQLAADILRKATEEPSDTEDVPDDSLQGKNPAAVLLGHLGGKKGGPARAAKLSADQRKEIAQKAAKARWEKTD